VSPGHDTEETQRSAELIEELLSSPDLRRRFRAQPGMVLRERGLGELAEGLGEGPKALMTLELRESRSSLAGVMVAAAAEWIELGHMLEHAAPALGRQAGHAMEGLVDKPHHAVTPARHAPAPAPRRADPLPSEPTAHAARPAGPASPRVPAPSTQPAPEAATPQPAAPAPAADPTPGSSGGGVSGPAQHGGPGHVALEQHHGAHPAQDPGLLHYPGDDAVPQALAAWMGAHARQAGLPPELPVMAALTESGLHNLNYGDRDSVGFFQMRLGIWNTGAYSGYPHHPELQLQWFIEHALAARQADPALAQSPGTWGEWVANVEQPAAEYRGRYQLQLGAAQELLHGSGQGSVPLSTAPTPVPAPLQHLPIGRAAIKVALEYLTTPHQGGSGLDGSTLVQYAYGREGLHLPGVASELLDVGTPIARHALRPGDAVFFAQPDGRHRVGLYIGDGRYVSIPREGGHAKVRALAEHSADGDYAAARRYTPESVSDPSRFARSLPTIKR
jgi:cell wall-associated NlpC family hydrolase